MSTSSLVSQGDAFGMVLKAQLPYLETPGMVAEIVERDDGDIVANDASRYFRGVAAWSERTRWAFGSLNGRVVDIGVGAGRHALEAQRMGHHVVGIDPSGGALEVCRARGLRETARLAIDQMPDLGHGGFDTVLLLGQNLALLGAGAEGVDRLRMLRDQTRPGATIIGDCISLPRRAVDEAAAQGNDENETKTGHESLQVRLRVRWRRYATDWSTYTYTGVDALARMCFEGGWELRDVRSDPGEYTAVICRR